MIQSQLDLPFWTVGTLRECTTAYLATQCEHVAEATLHDYWERARWLWSVFGESCPLTALTFVRMEGVVREYGPKGKGLMNTTIKRRLVFLRACMKYAAERGIITADQVVKLPLKQLKNDGRPRKAHHTVDQYAALRDQVPPGRWRRFTDLGFWTGHHSLDLFAFEGWMLQPNEPYLDTEGNVICVGRYWRRNHKNKRCTGIWLPMQPELRELALAWQKEPSVEWRDSLNITGGRISHIGKTMACAADRAALPRLSPIDLRRSFATMLSARGYTNEFIRQSLGHEGEDSRTQGGESTRPTIATRHYIQYSPDLAKLRTAA